MWQSLKARIKSFLRYAPLPETAGVRRAIDAARVDALPYCPDYEGDLLFGLIRKGAFKDCLETGFHTGSTALYMLAAVADRNGTVTSVAIDDEATLNRGRDLLRDAGYEQTHHLIRENSNRVLPEFFLSGRRFDLIYMDGWKTFDHLAMEMYFFNQLLNVGGVIVFDDSDMPSVRRAIRLLKRYYGYREVDYRAHGQTRRLRLFHMIAYRTLHRPYRALEKTVDTAKQQPIADWHFDEPL